MGPIKPATGRTVLATANTDAPTNINAVDTTNTVAKVSEANEANKADQFGYWGGGIGYYPSWGWGTGYGGIGHGSYGGYGHHHHHHHGGFGWRKLLTTDKADKANVIHTDNSAAAANGPANINNADQGWGFGNGGWDSNLPSGYGQGARWSTGRWGGLGWRKLLTTDKADKANAVNTDNLAAAASGPANINNADHGGFDDFGWTGNFPTGYGSGFGGYGYGGHGPPHFGTWGRKLLRSG